MHVDREVGGNGHTQQRIRCLRQFCMSQKTQKTGRMDGGREADLYGSGCTGLIKVDREVRIDWSLK